ncbi:PucR C-terminal helix-turn-helix domain-containing protein [Friedmanniella luteola]|uniref:PucR C-terminal helix-turn-helix domain-containing protein n=1 Tax=Friedmanniella luteola TaxID=546871 RepID=A0A1H1VIM8_9ACTN|nr:helix-turn-helix domain-containing protein [Friedmanniella luteola]SDS84231.1 PucR C-terminal helix-turn-helix domain-containing protein [Friedmanniella luteola]
MRPELQDIVDETSRLLRADVTLEDRDFNLVGYGTQRSEVDAVRRSSILLRTSTRPIRDWFEQFGIATSPDPLRTPADPAQGVRSRLCLPCRWRGVTYGYLWALDEATALDDPAVRRAAALAEHAASYLAAASRQQDDTAYAVADLVSPDLEKALLAAERTADAGVLERGTPVVAVVVGAFGGPTPAPLAPNLWSLPRAVLTGRGATSTTLVVPVRDAEGAGLAEEAAVRALELYAAELPSDWPGQLVAGLGSPRPDAAELRGSWLEARLAARVGAAVPALGPVARWSELGLYRLLAALPRDELAPLVLDPPVRRLLEHGDPELVRTVLTYLDRAGNVQEAAEALHVHRQTLYYRLTKVETLTGLRFGDGQDRTWLHLALLLQPLLDAG